MQSIIQRPLEESARTQEEDGNGFVRGHIKLMAVGDIMLGDIPWSYGSGVGSTIERMGPTFPFENCWRQLKEGDIVFGNLEAVLSRFNRAEDRFESTIVRAQPEAVLGLAKAGFNVLSLANNHIMQHGRQAVIETAEILRDNGIASVGVNIPEMALASHTIIERSGMRVACFAYDLRPGQYGLDEALCARRSLDEILWSVEEVKGLVEHVVVSLHWGDEFIRYPSPTQVCMGRKIIETGASLVLGHHPHIVQGIERYRKGIIVYSMGNFVFDLIQSRFRKSIILRCDLDAVGGITCDLIPIEINRYWQPTVMSQLAGDAWLREIDEIGGLIKEDGNLGEYEREVELETRRFRRETYYRYILGLLHFPRRHLLSNVMRIIKNRIPTTGR